MFAFEDIKLDSEFGFIIFALALILVAVLLVLMVVGFRYKWQQHNFRRQAWLDRDVADRRRIRLSDKQLVLERDNYTCQICGISKDFLDNYCDGLGDYLLLEVDHIKSVSQGGTGSDIDNLQCLCWRCNRKKGGLKTNKQVRNMIDYGMKYLER